MAKSHAPLWILLVRFSRPMGRLSFLALIASLALVVGNSNAEARESSQEVIPHHQDASRALPAPATGSSGPSQIMIERTRREFDKLGLQMVGVTRIGGDPSVFLKYRGFSQQQLYGVGQVIGGFRIISIQPEYTVFEGNQVRLWLALTQKGEDIPRLRAEPVPVPPLAAPAVQADDSDVFVPVRHKEAAGASKIKTRNFAKEIVFQDAPTIGRAADEGPGRMVAPVTVAQTSATTRGWRFAMPIDGRVTSGFGYRKQPRGGARRYHKGVDIQAPYGTPIRASASGVVKEVSRSWAKGLNILIEHPDGYATAYFHLSKASVKEGQRVAQGQHIGNEGLTGITTGPHLHFEIHKNGQPVDPALYLKELAGR